LLQPRKRGKKNPFHFYISKHIKSKYIVHHLSTPACHGHRKNAGAREEIAGKDNQQILIR